MRAALASCWTAGIAWGVMTALHGRWLVRSTHAGDVLSAYGAGLVVLGVLVGSRPYLRAGFTGLVQAGLPRPPIVPIGGGFGKTIVAQIHAERPRVVLDVLAERILAVALVVLGTLLNGWATPLARRWGLPV